MTTPSIVQSAFARGTGAITVTLASPPTTGNVLLLVVVGRDTVPTLPSPFVDVLNTNQGSFQGARVGQRIAQSGDGASYTLPSRGDWENVALFEFAAPAAVRFAIGTLSGTSPVLTLADTTLYDPAVDTRLLVLEFDVTGSATSAAGLPLLSPAGWQNATGSNHNAAIFQAPANVTSQAFTMSSASTAFWLDIQLATGATTTLAATQYGVEVAFIGTPSAAVTQYGVEIAYVPIPALLASLVSLESWAVPNPPLAVTLLSLETWAVLPSSVLTSLLSLETWFVPAPPSSTPNFVGVVITS